MLLPLREKVSAKLTDEGSRWPVGLVRAAGDVLFDHEPHEPHERGPLLLAPGRRSAFVWFVWFVVE